MARMRIPLGALLTLVAATLAVADTALPGYTVEAPLHLQDVFGTRAAWTAVVTAQSGGFEDFSASSPSQAKICFVSDSDATNQCTYFKDLFKSDLSYQELSDLSVAPLASVGTDAKGLILHASGSYPSGNTHEMAIWVYDARRDAFRLASTLQFSEERIFTEGPLDGYLITANWQWEQGETRFGSDHKRKITAYQYVNSDDAGVYRKVLEYTTADKYDPENTNTIDAEMTAIESQLDHGS